MLAALGQLWDIQRAAADLQDLQDAGGPCEMTRVKLKSNGRAIVPNSLLIAAGAEENQVLWETRN